MKQRAFGQYCGLARAVEIVGERWALLLVRDLLVRPRRYTDLREGLAGIPTNVLSARLRELEAAGVVQRELLPSPERGVVYALTASGRALEEAVEQLGRWGATRLGDPRPGETVTPESLVMALRSTFHPASAATVTATWQIQAGEISVHAQVDRGVLAAGVGPAPVAPDLVMMLSSTGPPPLKELMSGEISPKEALAAGSLHLAGKSSLLSTFVKVFRIESSPSPVGAPVAARR